jgi:hypothetical protein
MSFILAAIVGGILYRLRGGWFSNLSRRYGWEWGGAQRTQTMRAIWSIPTGLLLFFLAGGPWYLAPLLIASVFASLALWGHGAHMVYDATHYVTDVPTKGKTELLTEWWLPQAFGGIPDTTWPHWKVTAYNLAGMSFIGLVRNFTAVLPLLVITPVPAVIFGLTGLLHGPLYWAGYRINGTSETSEVLVGSVTWATIILLLG